MVKFRQLPTYDWQMELDQAEARENVRRALFEQAITIKGLAELAGVSVATLYNWLKDSNPNNLGRESLGKVAKALGTDIEHLFYNRPYDKASSTETEARARALRQIDDLLAGIDDPEEQARAANIIIATLRAARDEFERRRTAPPGSRKPGVLPTPSAPARHPRAEG